MTYHVGVMGPPCSGKSTLAAECFAELKKKGFHATLALEFVRDGFHRGLKVEDTAHQMLVYDEQRRRETQFDGVSDVTITDSPLFLTYLYGLIVYGGSHTDRMSLTNLYDKFLKNINFYDLVVVLEPVYAYHDDGGIRTQTQEEAVQIFEDMKTLLRIHKIPHKIFKSYDEAKDHIVNEVVQE